MPPTTTCPGCGSSNPSDFDDSTGRNVCTRCGTVLAENFLTSEITFGESSSGAKTVQGSRVAEGQTYVGGGRYHGGDGTSLEGREQSINEGKKRIHQLANALSCPESFADQAGRFYILATTNNFTKGRKVEYVTACCLYVVCRQSKSSHMLIDFSDFLRINVFVLGQTYLKLLRVLNVRIPNIDPTVYVHRFAKHLEFGPEQQKVASDALRIIKRMDRDWIVQGRRPSGICGAALLLAARMNNFRRSVREIVYVVKVADLTVHKRLQEFKDTRSGDLTVDEFRNIWLTQEHDPPSFGPKKKRKRVRQVDDDGNVVPDDDEEQQNEDESQPRKEPRLDKDGFAIPDLPPAAAAAVAAAAAAAEAAAATAETIPIDPALLGDASNGGEGPSTPAMLPTLIASQTTPDSYSTPPPPSPRASPTPSASPPGKGKGKSRGEPQPLTEEEVRDYTIVDNAIESEISALMEAAPIGAVDEVRAEQSSRSSSPALSTTSSTSLSLVSEDPENLSDVDDDPEVASCILTEEESAIKEKIWTEFNREYLVQQELKKLRAAMDARNGIVKTVRRRKPKQKPRDSSCEDLAESPAAAATQMLRKKAYSTKINYKAIETLFDD